MLKQLNSAIEYIEANLCAEFNLDTLAPDEVAKMIQTHFAIDGRKE